MTSPDLGPEKRPTRFITKDTPIQDIDTDILAGALHTRYVFPSLDGLRSIYTTAQIVDEIARKIDEVDPNEKFECRRYIAGTKYEINSLGLERIGQDLDLLMGCFKIAKSVAAKEALYRQIHGEGIEGPSSYRYPIL